MEDLRVPIADEAGTTVKKRFQDFLLGFRPTELEDIDPSNSQMILMNDYMTQINSMIANAKSTIYVNFQHLIEGDFELAEALETEYYRFEPYLRHALQDIVAMENQQYVFDIDKGQREFFVSFYNQSRIERIRAMTCDKIGKLISISGTVTRSSEVRPELLFGDFMCIDCSTKLPNVEQQFQYTEPQVCRNPQCAKGSGGFQLMMEKSAFVDWQRLRVQENADEIPPGSMPRCIDVICRNEVVEVAKAGDKVVLTGTVAVVPDTSGLARVGESTQSSRQSGRGDAQLNEGVKGLQKLGVKEMTYRLIFVASAVQNTDQRTGTALASSLLTGTADAGAEGAEQQDIAASLTDSEKADIIAMRNTPSLYAKMIESICPTVFGHKDVKSGILLMLFGGVHKKTKEGISLRGDLNVCIVGDPSCAKSQFLKYVHGFLPRTVYTSGKSSSAAGLTASVVRDADTGEFCVEAGALMLADNGICCIDEFDKMDPNDQVAIHEAMEQQTISITKAGIQATLNARTSILAAANPVFGRYDRTKTLKANVAVSAAIMSRFDLFFVILDECDPTSDEKIARHIIGVHKEGGVTKVSTEVAFARERIQKYIQFARCLNPVLTRESRKVLVECYRLLRGNDILGKNKTAYRITVRQLESLVRLSEALARLHLDEFVQPVYVREAYRLLQKSIIFVETEDVDLDDNEEEMERIGAKKRSAATANNRDQGGDEDGDDANGDGDNYEDGGDDHHRAKQARRDRAATPSEEQEDAAVAQEQAAPALKAAAPAKKAKQHISAEEYQDTVHLLALRLKTLEENTENFAGCRWEDLLTWYLTQYKHEMTSLEVFEGKKKLINQIIRRMIKHDGSIMVVNQDTSINYDSLPSEEKVLRLHPSYQG